jgi:hypothetical protein
MSIQSMRETRRKGQSKRLETILALVEEAKKKPITSDRLRLLVDNAVQNATGLNAESSRNTFRRECEIVTDPRVIRAFHSVLKLGEDIWQSRNLRFHSQYHVVMAICEKIRGTRRSLPMEFSKIEKYYADYGTLPL